MQTFAPLSPATFETLQRQAEPQIRSSAFSDPLHGWLGVEQTLLATNDGGQSWQPVYDFAGQISSLTRPTAELGWTTVDGELMATQDGGATWHLVTLPDSNRVITVRFAGLHIGWLTTIDEANPLLLTADGGQTWYPITNPCAPRTEIRPAFLSPERGWIVCIDGTAMGQQGKRLYATIDGGTQWTLLQRTPGDGASGNETLALGSLVSDICFFDAQTGWLTASGGLLITDDGGLTWHRRAIGILDAPGRSAEIQCAAPGTAYLVQDERPPALLVTRDGAQIWEQVYPKTITEVDWASAQFFDAQHGVALGTRFSFSAVLRTENGGRTWRVVGYLPDSGPLTRGPYLSAYRYGSSRISFVTPEEGWAIAWEAGNIPILCHTTDGGATWTRLPPPRGMPTTGQIASLSMLPGGIGYLSLGTENQGQLFTTRDGGQSFSPIGAPDPDTPLVRFTSESTGWKLLKTRLWATADGGRSWLPLGPAGGVSGFGLLPSGFGWLFGAGTLQTTGDGGKTWTSVFRMKEFSAVVHFADPAHGWMKDYWGPLYRTSDGGYRWMRLSR